MNGLEVSGIRVRFGHTEVLRGIDCRVAAGETVVLFGPSGAGKTTLLRAIAGVEPAASGVVRIDGQDVQDLGPEHRPLGMAFQNFSLYPHLSAYENIASPLRARRLRMPEIETKVRRVADLLRIDHVLGHLPRELSNGQKQRTALARALVAEPPVLLLDDPLRNVDAKLRYEMRLELPPLLRKTGAAVIFVTQDFREAMALADRVVVLREGLVLQDAPAEEVYGAPATVPVAQLFGDPPMNLLSARLVQEGNRVRAEAAGMVSGFPDLNITRLETLLLGVRPEDVLIASPASGKAHAEILAVTPLHERCVLLLRTADGTELVASMAGAAPIPGTFVSIAGARHAVLFDPASGRRLAVSDARTEMVA
ncbi:MAG TPA: ABC transporter ATP-binding protein [Acetobacteraceae bacterium]|nr:ABC transporter ATP-binding protein [Acetobacteraceae bacterium]